MEDGRKLYLDEAIVKHIVGFESQWEAMIRDGREAALSFTKEGTALYKEVDDSFESNPNSEFKRLDIGEIRRGADNSYYVWVRETKADVKIRVYKIVDEERQLLTESYTEL